MWFLKWSTLECTLQLYPYLQDLSIICRFMFASNSPTRWGHLQRIQFLVRAASRPPSTGINTAYNQSAPSQNAITLHPLRRHQNYVAIITWADLYIGILPSGKPQKLDLLRICPCHSRVWESSYISGTFHF
jgi:hypothetical protein